MHMSLIKSDYASQDDDYTLLAKALWERLNPANWPFSLNDLPKGSALVGGAVRDGLLNVPNLKPDIDLVIPCAAVEFAQNLSDRIGATCVVLDEERDIARLVLNDWSIDFAKQIGQSLNEDLSRRDFKINAIALTLGSDPEIIDPLNGIQNLRENILVAISEENLIDDPLRILRGFRLMSEFNFSLNHQTKNFFIKHLNLLPKVAPERIKFEIQKLVSGNWANDVLPLMHQIGVLNYWSNKGNILQNQDFYLRDAKNFNLNELAIALPLIRLVSLLSDEGLFELRFSKKEIQTCKTLRKWLSKYNEFGFNNLNESERFNLHIELEKHLPALILAVPNKDQKIWLSRWRDPEDPLFHPSSPLDGSELKTILGVPEGPLLGEIIQQLSKEKAFNRLNSRDEAVELARYLWKQKQPLL